MKMMKMIKAAVRGNINAHIIFIMTFICGSISSAS